MSLSSTEFAIASTMILFIILYQKKNVHLRLNGFLIAPDAFLIASYVFGSVSVFSGLFSISVPLAPSVLFIL